MKCYSTKVKIKPEYKKSILHLPPKLTNEGNVVEIGELVEGISVGDRVIYNPEPNCFYDNHYYCDQEYIMALCEH